MEAISAQTAIQLALEGRWEDAVYINRKLLKLNPKDIEALNRLGRAYLELGKINQAAAAYKKVLRIDRYNPIAKKALEKLIKADETAILENNHLSQIDSTDFLEEPGKTKTISLIHLGSEKVLASLDVGDTVILIPHAHRVSVQTQNGKFIGRLPDDISRRLIKLMREGNQYETKIRAVSLNSVKLFIREIKRAAKITDIPSFPLPAHFSEQESKSV